MNRSEQRTIHTISSAIPQLKNQENSTHPPTGRIERLSFDSSQNVWGYFSKAGAQKECGLDDLEFGDLFAKGTTRLEVSSALSYAMTEFEHRSDLSNALHVVAYLLEPDFIENKFCTESLKNLVVHKHLQKAFMPNHEIIAISGAVIGHSRVLAAFNNFKNTVEGGQILPPKDFSEAFVLYLVKDMSIITLTVTWAGPIEYRVSLNGCTTSVVIRLLGEGRLLVTYRERNYTCSLEETIDNYNVAIGGAIVMFEKYNDATISKSLHTEKLSKFGKLYKDWINVGKVYLEANKRVFGIEAENTQRMLKDIAKEGDWRYPCSVIAQLIDYEGTGRPMPFQDKFSEWQCPPVGTDKCVLHTFFDSQRIPKAKILNVLPSELVLEIAKRCNFFTALALSNVNRRFHYAIDANSKRLAKWHVPEMFFRDFYYTEEYYATRKSPIRQEDRFERVRVDPTSTDIDFEFVLEREVRQEDNSLQPSCEPQRSVRICEFLSQLAPKIKHRITVHRLTLNVITASTLEAVADLFAICDLSVYELLLDLESFSDEMLAAAVKLIETTKPIHVDFSIACEVEPPVVLKLLESVVHTKLTKFTFCSTVLLRNFGDEDEDLDTVVPLPACPLLHWIDRSVLFDTMLIGNVITEWAHNKRQIVSYRLEGWDMPVDAAEKLRKNLMRLRLLRDIPIRIFANALRTIIRLEKEIKVGDDQDELYVIFKLDSCGDGFFYVNNRRHISTTHATVQLEVHEPCALCQDH